MPMRGRAPALPRQVSAASRSVLEALADVADRLLRHELGARVEVGRRDAAVDLQPELHDRPEALQEGLLPERAGEVAALQRILLGRAEVEAVGADFSGLSGLGDGLGERRREHVVAGEGADHVPARIRTA